VLPEAKGFEEVTARSRSGRIIGGSTEGHRKATERSLARGWLHVVCDRTTLERRGPSYRIQIG
jgi:hypothetical protein